MGRQRAGLPSAQPAAADGLSGHFVMGGEFNLVLPRVALRPRRRFEPLGRGGDPIPGEDQIYFLRGDGPQADGDDVTAYVRSIRERAYVASSADGGRTWTPWHRAICR